MHWNMPLSEVLETKKTLKYAQSDHLCLRASQEFSRAADFPHQNYGIMGKIAKWGSWKSWERPDGRTDLGSNLCSIHVDSSFSLQPFFPHLWDECLRLTVRWWGTEASHLACGTNSMYVGFCPFLFHDSKNSHENTSLVVLRIEKKNT